MDADELVKIEASLNSGAFDNALISALTLWRRTRDSEVADLVDAVATKIEPTKIPALPRSPKDAVQEAWMKLAKKARTSATSAKSATTTATTATTASAKSAKSAKTNKPGDALFQVFALSALLPSLYRAMPIQTRVLPYYDNASKTRIQSWRTRMSALADLDDDPRITSALLAFLRDVPFEMGDPFTGRWLYDPAIELCERLADKRAIPHLQSLIDSPPAKTQNLRDHLLRRLPLAIDAITKTATTFEAVSESLDRAKVTALRAQLGIPSRSSSSSKSPSPSTSSATNDADLIHQIVTAKTEAEADAARAVLIDSWLERGDPRGELATTTDEKRQRALIRAHDKEWVGPDLARVLELRTYRHGLLHSARLASTSAANAAGWTKAANAPALATLRTLDKGNANETVYTQFLTSKAMLSIHEVTATSLVMLKLLASRETSQRLKTLTLESMKLTGGTTLRILESPNFAGLKKIRFKVKPTTDLTTLAKDISRYMSQAARNRHEVMTVSTHCVAERAWTIADWLSQADSLHPLAMAAELSWHPDSIDIVMRIDATGKRCVDVATAGTAPFTTVLRELRNIDRVTITAKGDKPLLRSDKLAAAFEAMGVSAKHVTIKTSVTQKSK